MFIIYPEYPFKICRTYCDNATVIPDIDIFSPPISLAKFLSILLISEKQLWFYLIIIFLFSIHLIFALSDLYHFLCIAYFEMNLLQFFYFLRWKVRPLICDLASFLRQALGAINSPLPGRLYFHCHSLQNAFQ